MQQGSTIKSRLSLDPFDIKDDTLLTNLIALVTDFLPSVAAVLAKYERWMP